MKFSLARLFIAAVGLAAWATATPVERREAEIAKIVKRAVPVFSQWKMDQPDAEVNREKAIRAYVEAGLMARYVHLKLDNNQKWDTIFNNYFQPNDKSKVEAVFQAIAGATDEDWDGDTDGSDFFGGLIIINFNPNPDDIGNDCEGNPDKLLGWLSNIVIGEPNRAVMRICPRAFQYPLGDGTKCEDLDEEVSGKMSSLGGVFLHEVTHFDPISKIATGERIIDYGSEGYGPVNTRNFNKQSKNPVSNADQYRWFAQEYYWTVKCKKDFKAPKSNYDYLKCKANSSTSCTII